MVQKPRRVYLDLGDLGLKGPGAGAALIGSQAEPAPLKSVTWLLSGDQQPDTELYRQTGRPSLPLRLQALPHPTPRASPLPGSRLLISQLSLQHSLGRVVSFGPGENFWLI